MKPTTYPIVEGAYLRDVLDQPQAMAATLAKLRGDAGLFERIGQVRQRKHTRIVLTGMGSSLTALYPLELKLVGYGASVIRVETAELIHSMPSLLSEETIIVTVSQSGRSAEIVRLLEQNARRATILGMTNTAGSPLAEQSDLLLLTDCGEESTVAAKTYTSALAAMEVFGAAWCGEPADAVYDELAAAPGLMSGYLEQWREHVQSLAHEMEKIRQLYIVGRGRSLAASATAALITKESTRWPAEGMSSAAFRHGPLELIEPEIMVLVLEGESNLRALNDNLIRSVRQGGGRAEPIGPGAHIAALRIQDHLSGLLPILEILPIQMLTLGIAAKEGFEAGRFTHASKVTTIE